MKFHPSGSLIYFRPVIGVIQITPFITIGSKRPPWSTLYVVCLAKCGLFGKKNWCRLCRLGMEVVGWYVLVGHVSQGTIGCTPNSVPTVFICILEGFLEIITHKYPLYRAYIGISNRGTLVGVHPTIPWMISKTGYKLQSHLRSHAILVMRFHEVSGNNNENTYTCTWKKGVNFTIP